MGLFESDDKAGVREALPQAAGSRHHVAALQWFLLHTVCGYVSGDERVAHRGSQTEDPDRADCTYGEAHAHTHRRRSLESVRCIERCCENRTDGSLRFTV